MRTTSPGSHSPGSHLPSAHGPGPRSLARRTLGLVALIALALSACNSGAGTSTGTSVVTPVVNTFFVQTTPAATTPLPTATFVQPTAPLTDAASTSSTSAVSTTNPDAPSVTIARGDFLTANAGSCTPTTCKRVNITTSGWEKRQLLQITCHSSLGTTGPYAKNADNDGRFASSTLCFYGNAKNVYVTVNDVSSEVIATWRDW